MTTTGRARTARCLTALATLAGAVVLAAAAAHAQGRAGVAPIDPCPSLASIEADPALLQTARTPCLAITLYADGTSVATRGRSAERAGVVLRRHFQSFAGTSVLVPNRRALEDLVDDTSVLDLIPNRRAFANPKPDKPGGGKPGGGGGGGGGSSEVVPSGVKLIGADRVARTGHGVHVAVVDTGLDSDHPDLAGNIDGAMSFYPVPSAAGITGVEDDEGHGTHVGGIIAALKNTIDVVGVAPEATLHAVKILNSAGWGYDDEIVEGLQWVLAHSDVIKVVNMSLGGNLGAGETCDDDTIYGSSGIFADLAAAGVTVVVAAGNDRDLTVARQAPAGCSDVIAVASVMAENGSNSCRFLSNDPVTGTASYFTTDGTGVAISAPGERKEDVNRGCMVKFDGILSLAMGGGTTRKAGTSMAAPHVAGVAALLLEGTTLSPGQVGQRIVSTAKCIGTWPLPDIVGTGDGIREGVVDAVAAIANNTAAHCP